MNTTSRLPLALAVSFLASAFTLSASVTRKVEKTFPASTGVHVSVQSDLGSFNVHGQQGLKTVQITVHETLDADNDADANAILKDLDLQFSNSGNSVSVTARYHGRSYRSFWTSLFHGFHKPLRLKFDVTVPSETNLDLKTAGGSITINSIQGETKAKTAGGSLRFTSLNGQIDGYTAGGSISLDNCSGTVSVHTSGGSISVNNLTGSGKLITSGGSIRASGLAANLDAATSGGSIRAEFVQPVSGDTSLRTSGGSIRVEVPGNSQFNLDAATSGGSVHSDLPLSETTKKSRSQLQGKVNGGGPNLYLRTSGGSISVSS